MHIVGRSVVPVFFLRNEVVDQKYVFEKKIVFLASTNQISAGPTSVWPSFFSNPEKKKWQKGIPLIKGEHPYSQSFIAR